MSSRNVTTQIELDKALKDGVDWIEIHSPSGVWLEVSATGSATVSATGSATVSATGSATVRAYDSATVSATGSATVRAYDSATVRAYDSATVSATGSATVRATGSATVSAYDSATVRATGSATVSATPLVAVHLHSATVHVTGGTILDHTAVDLTDARTWCEYYGVTTVSGVATVYKAVDDQWTTYRGFDYSPGATPAAPDWDPTPECGGGLHFGPTPTHALAYHPDATRFLACAITLDTLVPLTFGTAKCKAPAVVNGCREVTIDGAPTPNKTERTAS